MHMTKSWDRGMALLEGTLWIATLLPLGLVSASVGAVVHDQAVLKVAPEAALRETSGGTLRWIPDGVGGRYEVDVATLRSVIAKMSENALLEVSRSALKAENVSTKACFWVFSVQPSNGNLQSPIHSECDARGPLSQEVSVETYMQAEKPKRLGIPRSVVGEGAGYVDRVIMMGVAIMGELPGLLDSSAVHRISYGAISFPRQEISL